MSKEAVLKDLKTVAAIFQARTLEALLTHKPQEVQPSKAGKGKAK